MYTHVHTHTHRLCSYLACTASVPVPTHSRAPASARLCCYEASRHIFLLARCVCVCVCVCVFAATSRDLADIKAECKLSPAHRSLEARLSQQNHSLAAVKHSSLGMSHESCMC